MREVDIERTAYPHLLGNITDREIIFRYTLEPEEISLVKSYKGDGLSLAVRLKMFQHLLSHNLPLSEAPQKVVDYVASQLQVSPETFSETRAQRYKQIKLIRKYTGFSPFTKAEQEKLEAWLLNEAEKQCHLVDLVNEAIFHLKETSVELPAFQHFVRFVSLALHQADGKQSKLLNQNISAEQKEMLDALLKSVRFAHRRLRLTVAMITQAIPCSQYEA